MFLLVAACLASSGAISLDELDPVVPSESNGWKWSWPLAVICPVLPHVPPRNGAPGTTPAIDLATQNFVKITPTEALKRYLDFITDKYDDADDKDKFSAIGAVRPGTTDKLELNGFLGISWPKWPFRWEEENSIHVDPDHGMVPSLSGRRANRPAVTRIPKDQNRIKAFDPVNGAKLPGRAPRVENAPGTAKAIELGPNAGTTEAIDKNFLQISWPKWPFRWEEEENAVGRKKAIHINPDEGTIQSLRRDGNIMQAVPPDARPKVPTSPLDPETNKLRGYHPSAHVSRPGRLRRLENAPGTAKAIENPGTTEAMDENFLGISWPKWPFRWENGAEPGTARAIERNEHVDEDPEAIHDSY